MSLRILILLCVLPMISVAQKGPKIKKYNMGAEYQINAIDFLDAKVGYAAGIRIVKTDTLEKGYYYVGVVLESETGGKKWTELLAVDNVQFMCLDMTSHGLGMVGGSSMQGLPQGAAYVTTDQGDTWKTAASGIRMEEELGIKSVQILTEKKVIATGRNCWQSNDGGQSWQLMSITHSGVQGTYFINPTEGFAVGAIGPFDQKLLFAASGNGGASWKEEAIVEGRQKVRDIFFVSNSVGFVLLSQSRLYRTVDGGETWDKIQLKSNTNARKVHFINEKVGFVIGLKGAILMSTNGGAKWKNYPIEHGVSINGISFVDHQTGFVAGSGGNVYLLKF